MKRLLSCLFLAAVAFAPLARAAAPTPKPTPAPRHTVISSISSDSITVDTGLKTTTYQIDKHTKCFFQGNLVTTGDLKAGMRVSITPGGFDEKTADTINANDVPKAPVAKATPAAKATPTPKKK